MEKAGNLTNKLTGEVIRVHNIRKHPAAARGKTVWVDDDGNAYYKVGINSDHPLYSLEVDEPYRTALRIGAQLAKARHDKKLSTRDICQMTGINHSNLSLLERGERPPSLITVVRLASVLGLELNLMPAK